MKFSIITPLFNGAKRLPAAIKSLLVQDFDDWEAVIVNDGSTDESASVAEELAKGDDRIRVVHQTNGGVAVARNRGMSEAHGDWIAWLDQDDTYMPDTLSRIAAVIDAHPDCSCVQFPYLVKRPDGSCYPCIPTAYSRFGGRAYSGMEAFDILFARRGVGGMNWQPWRFAYRRDSLPRFRRGVLHEDLDVLPLHLSRLSRVYIASEPVYVYSPPHPGSATVAFTPRRVRDILDVTAHVYADLSAAGLPPEVERGFKSTLAFNLFGFYLATPTFEEPDRSELLDAFASHAEWLLAIDSPPRTAWLKRLLLMLLGVRMMACLVTGAVSCCPFLARRKRLGALT